ncbi:hypothetical protein Bca101_008684 [Brassica carinata]
MVFPSFLRSLASSSSSSSSRLCSRIYSSSSATSPHTPSPTPTAPQKRQILCKLKSTSHSCAHVLSEIERDGGFQIGRSDLNRWIKIFEKQGQTQKALQIIRFKQWNYHCSFGGPQLKLYTGMKEARPQLNVSLYGSEEKEHMDTSKGNSHRYCLGGDEEEKVDALENPFGEVLLHSGDTWGLDVAGVIFFFYPMRYYYY